MDSVFAFYDAHIVPLLGTVVGKLVLALAILIVGRWLAGRFNRAATKLMLKSGFDDTLAKFLGNLCYGILLMVVVLATLDLIGINITSMLALLGAAGLAVGLALKDSLSNFAAGAMVVVFRPFKLGDTITVGPQTGAVADIGIFSTTLVTPDNQHIIIPNASIVAGTVINATAETTRRVDLILHLSGDDNLVTAKRVIGEVLAADTRILAQPAPAIGVEKLGTTHLELFVRPWVKTSDYAPVKADLQERLKLALDVAGIVIPARPVPVVMQKLP